MLGWLHFQTVKIAAQDRKSMEKTVLKTITEVITNIKNENLYGLPTAAEMAAPRY